MTVSNHIKRHPHARPSTISYLILRDEMLQKLREEMKPRKPSLSSQAAGVFRSLAAYIRGAISVGRETR